MAGSEGRVKQYYSNGKIKYDGEVKNGKYHGYGILYFDCFEEITVPLNYIDLKEAKKYAT
jgi:antitoxin component YwqK of YwqJK toxin-antitoxin module